MVILGVSVSVVFCACMGAFVAYLLLKLWQAFAATIAAYRVFVKVYGKDAINPWGVTQAFFAFYRVVLTAESDKFKVAEAAYVTLPSFPFRLATIDWIKDAPHQPDMAPATQDPLLPVLNKPEVQVSGSDNVQVSNQS